jgi:hypothetical protein
MAGFLKNFATRLGGSEGLLRPRLHSLFEPAPSASYPTLAGGLTNSADEHPLAHAFERVDQADPQVVVAESPPASERVSLSHDQRAGTLIVVPESIVTDRGIDLESRAARDDLAAHEHYRGPRRPTAARPLDRFLAHPPGNAVRDAPASKDAGTALRAASIVARDTMAASRHVQRTDAVEQMDAPRTHARRAFVRIPSSRSDASREATSEATREPAPDASGILQAPVVARIVSEPSFSAPRTPKSEPAIHVTIGRVEVRAVSSSTSDNRRGDRAPSPVMSLDEYLRTRAR